jgi:6-phosphofructokinase 2
VEQFSFLNYSKMPAILTVTFNPCLDVNVTVAAMKPEIKMRCENVLVQPGGGGINVARAIRRLGGQAVALLPSGGANGARLKKLLADESVAYIAVDIDGNTRENLIVKDSAAGVQYRLNMPGPILNEKACQALVEAVEIQPELDYLVISGSLAPGMKADIFDQLALVARRHKARLVVDTSGEGLRRALFCGAFLAKLSAHELASMAGRDELDSLDEIQHAARRIVEKGTRMVVVSLGAGGAFWMTGEQHGLITAPSVKTASTVGAGDSMVAGIIWALAIGRHVPEAVRYGVACGTAATMRAGTNLFRKADADVLLEQMKGKAQLI